MNHQEQISIILDQIEALKAENAMYKARCEQYTEAYDYLKDQILEIRRQRFGKNSKRYLADPEHPQLSLLNDVYVNFVDADAAGNRNKPNEVTQVAAHSRKKNPKITYVLPRRIQIIPLSDQDIQCSCGECKSIIKYEVKELIHYQPCVLEILEQRR